MSGRHFIELIMILITASGVILPIFIRRYARLNKFIIRFVSLFTLILVAAIVAMIDSYYLHDDSGAMFTRAFLIDGIAIYVLNNAPLNERKETS